MSYMYRMAKAYQEQLLQQVNRPEIREYRHSGVEPASRTGLATLLHLLTAPIVLFRRATDVETTV